eukprot:3227152-Lingulodinium_polyedra.AAC.1
MFIQRHQLLHCGRNLSQARSAAAGCACHARVAISLTYATVNSNGSVTLTHAILQFDAADACISLLKQTYHSPNEVVVATVAAMGYNSRAVATY